MVMIGFTLADILPRSAPFGIEGSEWKFPVDFDSILLFLLKERWFHLGRETVPHGAFASSVH